MDSKNPDDEIDISQLLTGAYSKKKVTKAQELRRQDAEDARNKELFAESTEEALDNSEIIGSILDSLLRLETGIEKNAKSNKSNSGSSGFGLVGATIAGLVGAYVLPKLLRRFGSLKSLLKSTSTLAAAKLTKLYNMVPGIGKIQKVMDNLYTKMGSRLSSVTGSLKSIYKKMHILPDLIAKSKSFLNATTKAVKSTLKDGINKASNFIDASKKTVINYGQKALDSVGMDKLFKPGAKALSKSAIKKIPILGAIAGLIFGAKRAWDGDYKGAVMEVTSGALSMVPGVGTAGSVGMDIALARRDYMNGKNQTSISPPHAGPVNAGANTGSGSDIKAAIAKVESSGSYTAKNPTSTAYGKYQFLKATYEEASKSLGKSVSYLRTPQGQEEAQDWLIAKNSQGLRAKGIAVNPFTVYGAHQQGVAGFARIMNGNPTSKDIKNMFNNTPRSFRYGNPRMDWINYWQDRFSGKTRTAASKKGARPVAKINVPSSKSKSIVSNHSNNGGSGVANSGSTSVNTSTTVNNIVVSAKELDPSDVDV